jgi:hypothetical protein
MAVVWKRSVIAPQVSCHRFLQHKEAAQARTVVGFIGGVPHPDGAVPVLSRFLQPGRNPTRKRESHAWQAFPGFAEVQAWNVQRYQYETQ